MVADMEKDINKFFLGCVQERQILGNKIKELKSKAEDVYNRLTDEDMEVLSVIAQTNLDYVNHTESVIKYLVKIKACPFTFQTFLGIYSIRISLNADTYNSIVDVISRKRNG